ncbi:MAG: D-alanine--D-alanine ligase A [Treponema sp. CETP13]|nr:MAG: D-alanine--D-alanine ligase A [Treponema sp. CETP13]
MKIAVLFGGKSGEHEVSITSATSVVRHINDNIHEIILIAITKNGVWYLQDNKQIKAIKEDETAKFKIEESLEKRISLVPGGGTKNGIACNGESLEIDIVLPILHGTFGEDGHLQGLLEMADIPYCGCGTMASALTMDKEKTKQVWEAAELNVVPYITMCKPGRKEDDEFDEYADSAEEYFGYPMFVKPCCAGSSVGANRAENRIELQAAVKEAFKWDEKIIIEECLQAREIECAVTGNISATCEDSEITAYSVGEIAPKHGFYDYDTKYNDPDGAELIIPAKLDNKTMQEIQGLAGTAFGVLGCSGLARVDFFIDKTDGEIYLNEINTLPGFTSISMFPKLCENAGLKYSDLIELILKLGIERYNFRKALKTSR